MDYVFGIAFVVAIGFVVYKIATNKKDVGDKPGGSGSNSKKSGSGRHRH